MSSTTSPQVRILKAERAGMKESQDRIFLLPHAVIMLDGASGYESNGRDGGWYAETLGLELRNHFADSPTIDLSSALSSSIATVAAEYNLEPGRSPSSTVAILRWTENIVDALLLGDSSIVV